MTPAKRDARVAEIKRQLADLDDWTARARSSFGRENCPSYGANVGKASELRRELLKLRDPAMHARLYG